MPPINKRKSGRNLTRSHEERMAYIHQQILHRKFPTRESLALDLGFSTDVIDADVSHLRKFKGLPLKYSRKPGGGTGYYYHAAVPAKIASNRDFFSESLALAPGGVAGV